MYREQKEIAGKICETAEDIAVNIVYIKGLADINNVLALCESNKIVDSPYTENMFFSLFSMQNMIADRIHEDTENLYELCNSLKDNKNINSGAVRHDSRDSPFFNA